MTPESIAGVVSFLASKDAESMTGLLTVPSSFGVVLTGDFQDKHCALIGGFGLTKRTL